MGLYEEYLQPICKDGDVLLEVECGENKGLLYLSKLCQGSKGESKVAGCGSDEDGFPLFT